VTNSIQNQTDKKKLIINRPRPNQNEDNNKEHVRLSLYNHKLEEAQK